MRLLGYLIITVSLVVGVVGAVTAYLPRLSMADDRLIGLTLAADAGRIEDAAGKAEPIARSGATVDAAMLASLRSAGVGRIKVKEFALGRWSEWWMFLLGCAGLIGGAMLVRGKRAGPSAGPATAAAPGSTGAAQTVEQIRQRVASLRQALASLPEDAAAARVLEDLGAVQRDLVPAFIAARPEIVARRGLAGFAQVMDAFAAAERQINRAWSAAADDVMEESIVCIGRAAELLEETQRRLGG